MPENGHDGWIDRNVTEPVDWEQQAGPARPRHIREAEAAQLGPETPEKWRRVRAVAEAAGKAAPYVGAAGLVGYAATEDWDGDGHGDLVDLGDYGDSFGGWGGES
ncbi:hypothetical protein EV191_110101 [Tamaricihabitans halophyticus]|uniref:Uncharacterized protein n=1 Tax=Tamaricihabitans halophyticus TaxID=1262583 RepID=A0A4R2QH21_9PSEU|nr:hypothetical protein [Tamaricihabitans halophyticus]TCP48543.1 hypothetical protein EV191_110101 [Tamaricihabitans halophyticus]